MTRPQLLPPPPEPLPAMGEVYLLPMPLVTFKALSDEAAKRGMTFSQLLALAIQDVLKPR